MFPTLKAGQDILSFNWVYLGRKPKVGDIVVIKVGGKELIKRVQNVLDHEVFVTGDNQKESIDSRHFGLVEMNQIIGKLVYPNTHQIYHNGYSPHQLLNPKACWQNHPPFLEHLPNNI